ncbi:hypothetical protein DOY81_009362 [Sarcophaga bullata]|nr:hypothetical protein DOY81_009362 [Sarcophaga bullata]
MNPEPDDQLTSEKEATDDIQQQQQQHQLDQSMSDDEENIKSPEDLSLRQTPQQSNTTAQATTNSTTRPNQSPEMIRTAAKELIERYFYQLQRGCGNPKCSNVNCASSGKVAPMTANEMAAKAIQLFSRDAKLCDSTNQPPKVARRLSPHESPTSSRLVNHNNTMPLTINEAMDTYTQQQDHSNSASSSSASNSTITSGSSSSTTSSSSTGSSNTNISSCATEEMPLLVALGETSTPTLTNHAHTTGSSNLQATNSIATLTKTSSDPPTPTLATVEYLNEQILDDLIEECKKYDSYDRLVHALNEFRRPPLVKLASTATASKLQEILGKSPQDLKKEDLRTLEGEHDKDEDSSCVAQDTHEGEDSQQLTPEQNLNNSSANAAGSSSNSTSGGSGRGW